MKRKGYHGYNVRDRVARTKNACDVVVRDFSRLCKEEWGKRGKSPHNGSNDIILIGQSYFISFFSRRFSAFQQIDERTTSLIIRERTNGIIFLPFEKAFYHVPPLSLIISRIIFSRPDLIT